MQVQFICNTTDVNLKQSAILEKLLQVQKQKKFPSAYIYKVDPSGLLHVKFN